MSFSARILLWLVVGVATGLFFGELVAPLAIVATGFVKLLQMTVLPYVTISIVTSLGGLSRRQAAHLGRRAGLVLAGLWGIGLLSALLLALAFPTLQQGSFFSTAMIQPPAAFDFIDLYIPSNPFNSLANNIVPAVVLFSMVLGVALIGIERKQVLLDVLGVASDTVGRATRFIVQLTPYGMFAVAAVAAGTLRIDQLARIQVYLVAYVAVALLLSLWVLPGLVAALTPIGYRALLRPTRDALVTAFVAGDLFIVLPALTEACKELLARHLPARQHAHASLPDVLVPASFNFPHTGKLLSLSFVLFAGWFANVAVPFTSYPALALTGLLTFFGSLNAAVPFLLDLFRIPADTFQLFLATGVINQRFGSLLAAVHTVTVGLLGSAAIAGAVRLDPRRITRYLVITGCLVAATLGTLRILFETTLRPSFDGVAIVQALKPVLPRAPVAAAGSAVTLRAAGDPVLDAVRARGGVRVCYVQARPPYAFANRDGELAGLDVEMAHQLAIDLQARLHLVPVTVTAFPDALASGECDIAMGGLIATPLRATMVAFSQPYMEETLAFVVPDHLRQNYTTWDRIRERGDVRIGVPDVPYFRRQLQQRLPDVTLVPATELPRIPQSGQMPYESMVLSAERGAFLTLLYPGYSVVVPTPDLIRVPVAYALPQGDTAWAAFIGTWLELHRRDGALAMLVDHWVFGKSFAPPPRRWSIARNVLHWIE